MDDREKEVGTSYHNNIHSIGVPVLRRSIPGRSGSMEGNRSSGGMLFCNHSCKLSLTEELVNFLIPSFGHGWYYFHTIDSV